MRQMRATRLCALNQWWKQSKTQHKALLRVAASSKENVNAVAAPIAPPAKVAAVRLAGLQHVTTAWLQRRAPQINSLSISTGKNADGNTRVTLKALVGGEVREAFVHYSEDGFYYDGQRENINRKREETALLQLASGAEREAAKRARQEAARLDRLLSERGEKSCGWPSGGGDDCSESHSNRYCSPSRSPYPIRVKTMCMCHMCM